MKKLLFLTIIFFSCDSAFAFNYPISPRPLRKLVIESETAIVGNVINVYDRKYQGKKKSNRSYREYKIAKIVVKEVLQGEIKNDTIEVIFDPNLTCPYPANYYEKSAIIAFLNISGDYYETHAMSYGLKTLDSEGISIYKTLIKEIQEILKINDSIEKNIQTVDWLVKCAENQETRWEGVFELNFTKEFSNDQDNNFKSFLNDNQLKRLKKAYLSSLEEYHYDFELSDLIYKDNSEEIDAIILEKLKKLPEEDYYYASDYILRLKYKNTSIEMDKLLDKYYEVQFDNNNVLERNSLVKEFITLIDK